MAQKASDGVTLYVRFEQGDSVSHGILSGDTIEKIEGDLFGARKPTGEKVKTADVKLLYPIEPPKVLAVGLNYGSHLGERKPPANPEIFYKPLTSLQHPGGDIVIPKGAKDVHFEAEFVIVIGKDARNVSEEDAPDYILGYTCGNDVSDRNWQNGTKGDTKDVQWWRAKGSDTFGPLGPAIAVGLDHDKSWIQLRLNGKVMQKQRVNDLIFGPAAIVSFVSRYITLTAGDVIYTGTPGSTSPMKAGDIVEVEIDGIGILQNPVVQG